MLTNQSTLVKDLSGHLRGNSSAAEGKRTQERVSGWLGNYDFTADAGRFLLSGIPVDAGDGQTYALDFPDISKEFGGRGMDGMAMGWDGSRGVTAMGHDFVDVPLVGAAFRRLENIFTLRILAYVFATRFLREAKGFRRILKCLSDNLVAVSARTHALLAGIRVLVKEERIRFIGGRPPKRRVAPPGQQLFAFA